MKRHFNQHTKVYHRVDWEGNGNGHEFGFGIGIGRRNGLQQARILVLVEFLPIL